MSCPRMRIRSPRTVQQMQPLLVSNSSSSAPITSSLSTPTSPNSFSMTAMRLPCFSDRMRFSSVVFPEPRKPVSTVTGTREGVTDMGRGLYDGALTGTENPIEERIVRPRPVPRIRVIDDGDDDIPLAARGEDVAGDGPRVLEQAGFHVRRADRHVATFHGAVDPGDGQRGHELGHP